MSESYYHERTVLHWYDFACPFSSVSTGLAGIDVDHLHAALSDGSAVAAIGQAEWLARHRGVDGTPVWLVDGRLMVGLQPASDFHCLGPLTCA